MKKLFLIHLAFIFLAGCTTIPHIDMKNSKSSPKIIITTGVGLDFNHIHENNIIYTSGYIYTYIYQDLGIKITTPANYEPYFSQKHTSNILSRKNNIIYPTTEGNQIWQDYIEIFNKDSQTSLTDEIISHHLGKGCTISTGIFDQNTTYYDSMLGFHAVYIKNKDEQTSCIYDTEFSKRELPLVFVMDPKHPEKYYKLAISDGCAPGPCSIFGTIEFF